MAKPKQKNGLGRGLNALFEQSDVAPSHSSKQEDQVKESAPAPKVEETPKQQKQTEKPAESVQASRKIEHASDIYISENAVETAKVVERQARTNPSAPAVQAAVTPVETVAVPVEVQQPVVKDSSPVKGDVVLVSLSSVHPNPDQPRTLFKKEEIEELAASINQDGLLQPILVRPDGEGYQIIAGERRWQACSSLELEEVPVRIWDGDDDKALELALIENIQRSDLNPIEEAYGYKRLMERKNMTQSEVAKTVSKGRSTVANALRLLELPEEAQKLLFEEKITAGHARAILSIPSTEGRLQLVAKLEAEKLSVREAESLARLIAGREQAAEKGTPKRVPAPASFKKAQRSLQKLLATPVRVKTVKGKNKIEIQFEDEEELKRIFDAISHVETKE